MNRFTDAAKGLLVSGLAALLLTGCGLDTDTDEAKQYDATSAMAEGNYDKAITMLEKDCAGFSEEKCAQNLGVAYLGKAGYTLTSIGEEIIAIEENTGYSDDKKEREITSAIFKRLLDDSMEKGVNVFKERLLDNNTTQCTPKRYQDMTTAQKNACIYVNPIMMKDLMDEEGEGLDAEDDTVVSLEMIIKFKGVAESIVPDMDVDDFIAMTSGSDDALDPKKDVNGNGDLDTLEVTQCILEAYSNGYDPTVCDSTNAPDQNITLNRTKENHEFGKYGTLDAIIATVEASVVDQNDTKQVRLVRLGDINTTVSTVKGEFMDVNGTDVDECNATTLGEACFPKPKTITKDGEESVETSNDAIVEALNDDDIFTSVAVSMNSESDTETAKTELKNDICYSNFEEEGTTISGTNEYLCADDGTFTQDAFINYANKDK